MTTCCSTSMDASGRRYAARRAGGDRGAGALPAVARVLTTTLDVAPRFRAQAVVAGQFSRPLEEVSPSSPSIAARARRTAIAASAYVIARTRSSALGEAARGSSTAQSTRLVGRRGDRLARRPRLLRSARRDRRCSPAPRCSRRTIARFPAMAACFRAPSRSSPRSRRDDGSLARSQARPQMFNRRSTASVPAGARRRRPIDSIWPRSRRLGFDGAILLTGVSDRTAAEASALRPPYRVADDLHALVVARMSCPDRQTLPRARARGRALEQVGSELDRPRALAPHRAHA